MITKRPLGKTGVEVTTLGFGTMELRGKPIGPDVSDDEAGRVLNAVLDAGINLIDTSIDYGRSEELIGEHLAHRRDEYFLASKCGCPVGDPPAGVKPPYPHDYSARNIRAGVEQSLRRLRTDRLDLLQLHTSPSLTEMESHDTIETLSMLQKQGRVRFLGMSGGLPNLPDHIAIDAFDVFQVPYSAVRFETGDLISAAARAGSGVIVRSGTGRGGAGPTDDGPGRWESSGVEEILGEMSRFEFILRYTITSPDVSSVLVGTSNIDHLRSNVAIAEKGPLPADLYEEASRRLRAEAVEPDRRSV